MTPLNEFRRKLTKAGLGTEKGVPSLCCQASGPPDKHSVWHSVPRVAMAVWRSIPKAGLQVLALRPKGTFQGQGPVQEKGWGQLDGCCVGYRHWSDMGSGM